MSDEKATASNTYFICLFCGSLRKNPGNLNFVGSNFILVSSYEKIDTKASIRPHAIRMPMRIRKLPQTILITR